MCLVLQATTGLVLPVERTTGLGCIPEGNTVSYECTVNDDGRCSRNIMAIKGVHSTVPAAHPGSFYFIFYLNLME